MGNRIRLDPRLSVHPDLTAADIDLIPWNPDYTFYKKFSGRTCGWGEYDYIVTLRWVEQVSAFTIITTLNGVQNVAKDAAISACVDEFIDQDVLTVGHRRIHAPAIHAERLSGDLEDHEDEDRRDGGLRYITYRFQRPQETPGWSGRSREGARVKNQVVY